MWGPTPVPLHPSNLMHPTPTVERLKTKVGPTKHDLEERSHLTLFGGGVLNPDGHPLDLPLSG